MFNDKYYNVNKIDKTNAIYRMIIGQRSNGKTYALCDKILKEFLRTGRPSAYIRRFSEDIKPKNIELLFTPHNIEKLTKGKYNSVQYRSNCFYFVFIDDKGKVKSKSNNFFCKTFSLNTWEHSKGADTGNYKYIVFDEFISRTGYISNEFAHFQNLLSSIIRNKDDVIIYMIANTVSKFCPYFSEMKIDIEKMEQGEIFVYKSDTNDLSIAVEYCETNENVKSKTVKYYEFDNATVSMITSGAWEIPSYPHLYFDYSDLYAINTFYIDLQKIKLIGKIMRYETDVLIYIYPNTKNHIADNTDVFYTDFPKSRLHQKNLMIGDLKIHKLIQKLIREDRLYFSDNETGDKFFNILNN